MSSGVSSTGLDVYLKKCLRNKKYVQTPKNVFLCASQYPATLLRNALVLGPEPCWEIKHKQ